MIKAVIFDLNGVFVQSPNLSDRFKEKFGVPVEIFLPALKEIMVKVRMPNAGDAFAYWRPYLEKWDVDLTEKEFFDFWFSTEKEVPELIELAKEVKQKGFKIFVLSNNFSERADYYKRNFSFLDIFDKIYYSWQTGFVKPSSKAFENLLGENNLLPAECLYFDNSEENIKVANALGINAHLFEDINSIKKVIL